MSTEPGQLHRDRIPEIIQADGHTCSYTILDEATFIAALRRKLIEEAEEAANAGAREDVESELADILEVVRTITVALGLSLDDIELIRQQRALKRGAFDRRILLEFVDERA